jgi:beta-N-acetylhexosaminidase
MPEFTPQPNPVEYRRLLPTGDEGMSRPVTISLIAAGMVSAVLVGSANPGVVQNLKERVGSIGAKPTASPETSPTPKKKQACTEALAEEAIDKLSIRAKVGQLLMPGFTADQVPQATIIFKRYHVGNAIVMGNEDGKVPESAAPSLKRLAKKNPAGLNMAVDDEGGLVQRTGDKMPSQKWVAEHRSPKQAEGIAFNHAKTLADYGINFNASPVVDVDPPVGKSGTPGEGRTFGNDVDKVTDYSKAYIKGIQKAGVHPIIKHWPGHGAASGDTHEGSATTAKWSALLKRDVVPFKTLVEEEADHEDKRTSMAVMPSHLTVPGLTEPGVPVSRSPRAMNALRDEIGFDGIIVTDDLGMGGSLTNKTVTGAAVAAIRAGADMAMYVSTGSDLGPNTRNISNALVAAVENGDIREKRLDASVVRNLAAKGVSACDAGKALK